MMARAFGRRRLAALLCGGIFLLGTATAEAPAQVITISLAGDCTLGSPASQQESASNFVSFVKQRGLDWPLSGVRDIFRQDDLTLVNFEGVLTDYNRPAHKLFTFRAPPNYARILSLGGVEAVNLANNHTMDFDQRGYDDTLTALAAEGVAYCSEEAPTLLTVRGVKVALLGMCYPLSKAKLETLYAQIAACRQGNNPADLVIVSFHWGKEASYTRQPDQVRAGQGAIDHGADVVVGTHPHLLQGMDLYQGKPIFYSLGNFCFGGHLNPGDRDSAVMQLSYDCSGGRPKLAELRIVPCLISALPTDRVQDYCPVPAEDPADKARILRKLAYYAQGWPEGFFDTGVYAGDIDTQ